MSPLPISFPLLHNVFPIGGELADGHVVNQSAVFASKQCELLPTMLMPGLISCGLCNFSTMLIF
jgi:hypothetical protein